MNEETLIVDLYELTMAAGYFEQQYNPTVTFELFIRELPEPRNYLVTAGLEQVIEYLQNLSFNSGQIEYLRNLPSFKNISQAFFDYLSTFHFSGNMYAIPEGTIVFANEPLIQIEAPLIEAQIVETYLLSMINFQTMVASKAARVIHAATSDGQQRGVMEFGSRRAHGPEASVLAARAAYLAGFMGTSNVLAGKRFDIPVLGTTAHSWTMAFESEEDAFRRYQDVFKEKATFLIDTYDTVQGVENAMKVADDFLAVRIDSGDLAEEARKIRKILDRNGRQEVKIILSSDLNEYKIQDMIRKQTPVDYFGVGTQVATSFDAPALQAVYKMVEIAAKDHVQYRAKFSRNKVTLPGRKQIWRFANRQVSHDLICNSDEDYSNQAFPLIRQYIRKGKVIVDVPDVRQARRVVADHLQQLPQSLLSLTKKETYPVKISSKLMNILNSLKNQMENKEV